MFSHVQHTLRVYWCALATAGPSVGPDCQLKSRTQLPLRATREEQKKEEAEEVSDERQDPVKTETLPNLQWMPVLKVAVSNSCS